MEKIISVTLLSILLAFSAVVSASAEQVTSNTTGFTNVSFSNGYYGFCIDQKLEGAYSGDSFTPAEDTTVATNNLDNRDVSQKLKIFFTQCFEDIFVSDGSGGYIMDSNKAVSSVPTTIYHFSDGYEGQYLWGESKTFVDRVNAYDGPEIPDEGYKLKLENGDVVTFRFSVMEPQKEGQQSFFAYKLEVGQDTGHEHNYSEDWKSDDTNHWHECECNDKADLGEHDGNTADCKNPSVCEICSKQLSDINPDNHTGETEIRNAKDATEFEDGYTGDTHCKDCGKLLEKGKTIPATHEHNYSEGWKSDDTKHWHECECNDKADLDEHDGNTADCKNPSVCEICGKQLSDINPDNHTGETEIRNAKDATEFEDGYTGDTHCKDCGKLLEKGETIPATHEHDYSEDWKSDDTNHWHECECGGTLYTASHSFENGVCTVCGKAGATEDEDKDSNINLDFDGAIDFITGILPDFGNNNEQENADSDSNSDTDAEENIGEEIPSTGSESSIGFVYAAFAISMLAAITTMFRRKKHSN